MYSLRLLPRPRPRRRLEVHEPPRLQGRRRPSRRLWIAIGARSLSPPYGRCPPLGRRESSTEDWPRRRHRLSRRTEPWRSACAKTIVLRSGCMTDGRFAAQANAQPEIADEPFEEFWRRPGPSVANSGSRTFTELVRVEPPYANVPRRQAERPASLRRPSLEWVRRRQGRVPRGRRAAASTRDHLCRAATGTLVRFANGGKSSRPKGRRRSRSTWGGCRLPARGSMHAATAPHTVIRRRLRADALSPAAWRQSARCGSRRYAGAALLDRCPLRRGRMKGNVRRSGDPRFRRPLRRTGTTCRWRRGPRWHETRGTERVDDASSCPCEPMEQRGPLLFPQVH